jgi:hypothetical protein
MNILFWLLVIPGAIITYLIIGFIFVLLLCIVTCGEDWKQEFNDDMIIPMILFWPFTLVIALIILPKAIMESVIEKITKE